MKRTQHLFCFTVLTALIAVPSLAQTAVPPERKFLSAPEGSKEAERAQKARHPAGYACRGPVTNVTDVGYEGVKTTSYNWSNTGGGGESGRFDRTPVLSTTVKLPQGACLDAHFSAIVGGRPTYGAASITMFQVTLTPVSGGPPQHMFGHYETPYGRYGPAVAAESERDVDMFAANFFQRVGTGPGDVPPGAYKVDVWWAGGPIGGGGAIGAAFVLKLYQR